MNRFLSVAALTVSVVYAAPAAADDFVNVFVNIGYTGKVVSGIDTGGRYGEKGANLAGQPFSLNFVYEPRVTSGFLYDDAYYLEGGSDAREPFTVSIGAHQDRLIGSKSYQVTGYQQTYRPDLFGFATYLGVQGSYLAADYITYYQVYLAGSFQSVKPLDNPMTPYSLLQGFAADQSLFGASVGGFDIAVRDRATGSLIEDSSFQLRFDDFVSGVVPSVPEPTTWVMMLVGFGAVGGTMRRRKSKVTTRVALA